jgi:hypothetical protein
MGTYLTFGIQLFIGNACVNVPVPAVDSYIEVGLIQTFGDQDSAGDDMSSVEVDQDTGEARTLHFRGAITSSNLEITCLWSTTDLGQRAVYAAYRDKINTDYNFKVVMPDGSVQFYMGPVMSHDIATGVGNNFVLRTFDIGINDRIP